MYDAQLTAALDTALRSVTSHAALTEAVLETCVVRLASPSETPTPLVQELVQELAQRISSTGLCVTYGPSWTPVFGADVSIGTRGLEETFEAFLRASPEWQPARREQQRAPFGYSTSA